MFLPHQACSLNKRGRNGILLHRALLSALLHTQFRQPSLKHCQRHSAQSDLYQKIIDHYRITTITNAFLFPTEQENAENRGVVTLPMMEAITVGENKKLSPIQVVFLPAKKVFDCYLSNMLYEEDLMLDNESM